MERSELIEETITKHLGEDINFKKRQIIKNNTICSCI